MNISDFELTKLRLEPGDIAVLSTDLHLRPDETKEIRDRFRKSVPDGIKILVLSSGLKVSALTRAEIMAMAE